MLGKAIHNDPVHRRGRAVRGLISMDYFTRPVIISMLRYLPELIALRYHVSLLQGSVLLARNST